LIKKVFKAPFLEEKFSNKNLKTGLNGLAHRVEVDKKFV
jgi:hypothetical protein